MQLIRGARERILNGTAKEAERQGLPMVALALPTEDMVHADFCMSLTALAYNPGARLALIHHKGTLVQKSRNILVHEAQRLGAQWLLFLDSDMTFPKWALKRLLSHNLDIVGGAYVKRQPPHELIVKILGNTPQVVSTGVTEVAGMPTGCLLVRMSVFEKLKRPYFRCPDVEEGQTIRQALAATTNGEAIATMLEAMTVDDDLPRTLGEDYYFCAAARAAGFKVHMDVDLTYRLGHIGQQVFKPEGHERHEDAAAKPATEGTEQRAA